MYPALSGPGASSVGRQIVNGRSSMASRTLQLALSVWIRIKKWPSLFDSNAYLLTGTKDGRELGICL